MLCCITYMRSRPQGTGVVQHDFAPLKHMNPLTVPPSPLLLPGSSTSTDSDVQSLSSVDSGLPRGVEVRASGVWGLANVWEVWEEVFYTRFTRKCPPAKRAACPFEACQNLLPSLMPNGLLSRLPNRLPGFVQSLALSLHPNLQWVSPFLWHPRSMFSSSR